MSNAARRLSSAWHYFRERAVAMAIVASLTLPAFGIRAYQTRVLEDPYGAEDQKDRLNTPNGPT
ncbi:MAG: hypothetical protein M3R44_03135 [Candidatus Eremiobacteraeota bacterium]|nr:hypothetical protein [Candidatus Eremiobacteraeota bacterium]